MHDPPPERPSKSDCCGNGCVPCVLDVYDEEYARWERRRQNRNGGDDRLRRDLLSVVKYNSYEIISVQRLRSDVYMFTFAAVPPAEGRLPVGCAQHVHIRVDGITRPYTPVSLSDRCSFDVIAKAYAGGRFTTRLLRKKVNDVVFVRGPSGGVDFKGYESIVMFCGGTGVAAFLGLVRSILEDDKCEVILQLHYSCKTLDDVLVRKTLAEYAEYWNCAVFLYLTRETNWLQCSKSFWFGENIAKGRISPSTVAEITSKITSKTLWLICGNDEFNKCLLNSLQNENIKNVNIKLFHNSN